MDQGSRKARLALLGAVLAGGFGLAGAQVPAIGAGGSARGDVAADTEGGVAAGVNANNGVNTGTPGNGAAPSRATGNKGVETGVDTRISGAAGSATGSTDARGTATTGSLQCPPEPGTVSALDCRVQGTANGTVNSSGSPVLRR